MNRWLRQAYFAVVWYKHQIERCVDRIWKSYMAMQLKHLWPRQENKNLKFFITLPLTDPQFIGNWIYLYFHHNQIYIKRASTFRFPVEIIFFLVSWRCSYTSPKEYASTLGSQYTGCPPPPPPKKSVICYTDWFLKCLRAWIYGLAFYCSPYKQVCPQETSRYYLVPKYCSPLSTKVNSIFLQIWLNSITRTWNVCTVHIIRSAKAWLYGLRPERIKTPNVFP